MSWTFLYLMLFLKLPIVGLLWLVWWAIHQTDEDLDGGGGGAKVIPPRRHPRLPLPRAPRRGPHGCASPPAPPRVRSVLVARGRRADRGLT